MLVAFKHLSVEISQARPIYWFAAIISQYWPVTDILGSICVYVNPDAIILKLFFKAGENAWTSD